MYEALLFRGRANVVKAFTDRGVEAWAIFHKKELTNKGMGAEELNAFLEMIEDNGTRAVLKLKIYEGVTDILQIKEKTEADGSFSFSLQGADEYEGDGMYSNSNRKNKLYERLGRIEERLAETEEDETEPETGSVGAVFLDLLKNPSQLAHLIEIGKSLLGLNHPQPAQSIPAQRVGYTGDDGDAYRIAAAIDKLEKLDHDLATHLEKLAAIAENNPSQFKFLLSTLDTLQP